MNYDQTYRQGTSSSTVVELSIEIQHQIFNGNTSEYEHDILNSYLDRVFIFANIFVD